MEKVISFLVFERSTKNQHLYKADADGYALGNVYVAKSQLPTPPPKRIKVTIEVA